ncbi:response regulator transcription factor [Roseateles amylovorans]|uniref:Response regulator transcription factor n=1 Tax=Roseateles amylovorans TaxID=2978473 RepID=A0ABY6ASF4_9BURK|nr:response regulator transcription factor [Roseateles amylovorans]UXH76166.1 response regulator transcription factor [Roseateles amylovorans]
MNSNFESARRIRVLVLYNESIVAAGLCAALAQQPDLELHDGAQADASGGAFDVVVCDYETGMALAQEDGQRPGKPGAEPPALILTSLSSEAAVVQAMARGVQGYVLLGGALEELLSGIRELARGKRYMSQAVAHRIVESMGRESLTLRETEVLQLLGRGQCNKSIARDMDISLGTVKTHVKAVMAKLGADSRMHAVTVAAHRGLIALVDDAAVPPTAPRSGRRVLATPVQASQYE